MEKISLAQLRRFVVSRQGFSARFRRSGLEEVEAEIRRLSAVQLDSITTVGRSHRIALTSRIGAYPEEAISELLRAGRIFEYWAHEGCFLPIELYPLFRRKMAVGGRWGSYVRALRDHGELVPVILAQIREHGPQGARHFGGAGGGMWDWKPEKRVLEALWDRGELAICGRPGFQRLYDLTERVVPRRWLDADVPEEDEYLRRLAEVAVRGRGALTDGGIVEHWRLRGGVKTIRPHVDALVAAGVLRTLQPDDGGPRVLVGVDAELDGRSRGGVLLSPFDNLLWDRAFADRVFGFRHVIEVYKREHERLYGYYVLPFLLDDRFVGRVDLKSERADGLLRVRALHLEPGIRRTKRLENELEGALVRLQRYLGLERVAR